VRLKDKPDVGIAIQYPINQQGGTEVLVKALALGLGGSFYIHLVSPDTADELGASLSGAIQSHIQLEQSFFTPKCRASLASELKRRSVSFVHVNIGGLWDWSTRYMHRCPILDFAQSGIRYITTVHGVFELVPNMVVKYPKIIRYLLMPYAMASRLRVSRGAEKEFFVSQHDYKKACRWLFPYHRKFGQIYHSQLGNSPYYDIQIKEKVIICVGTIGGRKGQPYLAEAFSHIAKQYPDWSLKFVGRVAVQSDYEKAQKIVQSAGVSSQVTFTGPISDEDLLAIFKKASIFAMPSLAEGLGLSLQEAIYNGCVPIGSRVGGIPELIEDQVNGLLVEPCDVVALAQGLRILMDSDNLRRKYADAGQQLLRMKHMSQSEMLDAYRMIYNSYIPKRKS